MERSCWRGERSDDAVELFEAIQETRAVKFGYFVDC